MLLIYYWIACISFLYCVDDVASFSLALFRNLGCHSDEGASVEELSTNGTSRRNLSVATLLNEVNGSFYSKKFQNFVGNKVSRRHFIIDLTRDVFLIKLSHDASIFISSSRVFVLKRTIDTDTVNYIKLSLLYRGENSSFLQGCWDGYSKFIYSSLLARLNATILNQPNQATSNVQKLHKTWGLVGKSRKDLNEIEFLKEDVLTLKECVSWYLVSNSSASNPVAELLDDFLWNIEKIEFMIDAEMRKLRGLTTAINARIEEYHARSTKFQLKITIASLALNCGALVAGVFGMNLLNHMERQPRMFATVNTFIALQILAFSFALYVVMRREVFSDK
jgi:hypothetical protein